MDYKVNFVDVLDAVTIGQTVAGWVLLTLYDAIRYDIFTWAQKLKGWPALSSARAQKRKNKKKQKQTKPSRSEETVRVIVIKDSLGSK